MKTSALLSQLVLEAGDAPIAIGTLTDRLADRGIGLLLLVFALPNCFPFITGISTVLGTPIFLLALNLVLGRQALYLPERIRRQTIPASAFARVVRVLQPMLRVSERLLCERAEFVFGRGERAIGLVLLLLAFILILPMPFMNFIPAVCIVAVAIGLLERDGLAIIAALCFTLLVGLATYTLFAEVIAWLSAWFSG